MSAPAPAALSPDEVVLTRHTSTSSAGGVSVQIGTSALSGSFARELCDVVNRAYGYRRVSEPEIVQRLSRGDGARNRVLHVAMRGGAIVGCCSSTLHTPWTGPGCGHWGLLAVDPEAQGMGVATALVAAAEQRIYSHGLRYVAIECAHTWRAAQPTRRSPLRVPHTLGTPS